jgi:naphthoate synthase
MAAEFVSEIFDAGAWQKVDGFDFEDITYHRARELGAVRIAFHRPEVRNAFRPKTVDELYTALEHARTWSDVGAVLITGNGPSPKDGGWAFCSGGDQRIRGKDGYKYEGAEGQGADLARLGRLHILEVQRLIRFSPKVVIAVVPGWAVGGGHSLHVVCDLTIASREHAIFKQTDPDVASFDSGYGSALLARQVGQKRAREIFFLGKNYSAEEAFQMGMVNEVVPHAELEKVAPNGARRTRKRARPPSACSSTASTCRTKAWSASSCSPVKRRASPTAAKKPSKVATRSCRSGSRTSPSFPGSTERCRGARYRSKSQFIPRTSHGAPGSLAWRDWACFRQKPKKLSLR